MLFELIFSNRIVLVTAMHFTDQNWISKILYFLLDQCGYGIITISLLIRAEKVRRKWNPSEVFLGKGVAANLLYSFIEIALRHRCSAVTLHMFRTAFFERTPMKDVSVTLMTRGLENCLEVFHKVLPIMHRILAEQMIKLKHRNEKRANVSFWSSRGIHRTKFPTPIRNDLAFKILDMLEPWNFNHLIYKVNWWHWWLMTGDNFKLLTYVDLELLGKK